MIKPGEELVDLCLVLVLILDKFILESFLLEKIGLKVVYQSTVFVSDVNDVLVYKEHHGEFRVDGIKDASERSQDIGSVLEHVLNFRMVEVEQRLEISKFIDCERNIPRSWSMEVQLSSFSSSRPWISHRSVLLLRAVTCSRRLLS